MLVIFIFFEHLTKFKDEVIIAIEILLTLTIAFDIFIKKITENNYWKSIWNVIDFIVFLLVTIIQLWVILQFKRIKIPDFRNIEKEDSEELIIIIVRYSI